MSVELQLLMPLDALLNPNTPTAAEMAGHGPLPAGIARDILHSSRGRRWWRRLFTAPAGGPIVGGDRFRRRFDGGPITMANGRGLCERGNYVHEMPGWQASVIEDGRHGHPHTVVSPP